MIEQPPSFDEFMKIVEEVGRYTLEKDVLDAELKLAESNITKECMFHPEKYSPDGKIPSMSFIQNAYHYVGFNGELTEKRLRLATVKALLAEAKLKFEVYSNMLELYRTESANRRNSVVI
jgi:hypothetical protein